MNLKDFWNDEYLQAHKKYPTRLIHALGTLYAAYGISSGIVNHAYWFCLSSILISYGLAWGSHFFIEKNVPETFKHPLLSFLGDLKMTFLVLTRQDPFPKD